MPFLLSKAFGLSEWPFIWPSLFIFIFGALSKHPCVYYHLIYKGNTEASLKLLHLGNTLGLLHGLGCRDRHVLINEICNQS